MFGIKSFYSLRYIIDRIRTSRFEKMNPHAPWLNRHVITALEGLLQKEDFFVECGSGRSTVWFAQRVQHVLSLEHDATWYKEVARKIEASGLTNIDYCCVDYTYVGNQTENEYTHKLRSLEDETVDACLIDGGPRSYCALELIPKLKRNGFMIIDDVHESLPSESLSPHAIRTPEQIPKVWNCTTSLNWVGVFEATAGWRKIQLSDGVKDSSIYIKP